MFFSRLIFKLFPTKAFIRLRKLYRSGLKILYSPLTESEFKEILSKQLGITEGTVVFVHSSVDSLNLAFDSLRLLEILIEAVGDNGTLVFPCWHFTGRAEEYLDSDKVFDVRRSPSALGLLSELARRYPGAHRSLHPTNSIVAIGKQAGFITGLHHTDIYPCGEKSPYYQTMLLNGVIAGIGVNANFMSFVHCPEDVLKQNFPVKTRLDKVYESKVKKQDGTVEIVKTLAAHPQIRHNDINAFLKKHISKQICSNLTLKGNRFFICDSRKLFNAITELSAKNKTIYTKRAEIRNEPK